jgi:CDGSH-type Zn-finger protein
MSTTKKVSMPVAVEAGKTYSWCTCGLTQTAPLCDGSHQKTADLQPLSFVAEQTTTVFLCACVRTEDPPYCDGLNCDS